MKAEIEPKVKPRPRKALKTHKSAWQVVVAGLPPGLRDRFRRGAVMASLLRPMIETEKRWLRTQKIEK
jgi:hypothetical protein